MRVRGPKSQDKEGDPRRNGGKEDEQGPLIDRYPVFRRQAGFPMRDHGLTIHVDWT